MNWGTVFNALDKSKRWAHPRCFYLGCGFKFCWLFWFETQAAKTLLGSPLAYQMLFAFGQITAYLLIAVFFKRKAPFSKNVVAVLLSYAILLAGTILLALQTAITLAPLAWAVLVMVVTMASAFTMILWLEIYACFPSRHSIQIYAESLFVSIVLWIVVSQLPATTSSSIACALPIALAITWVLSWKETSESVQPEKTEKLPSLPKTLMLWMGLVYFSFNF